MTPDMYPDNKRLSAWLLTVLILFGQAAEIIHQSEHDVLERHDSCAECLAQSSFDGKLVVAVHNFSILLADTAPPVAIASTYQSHHTSALRARSPPPAPA